MTTKNLSTVSAELIVSYGNTAKNVIQAYRVGGERVIGFMDRRWENALEKSAHQLKAEVRSNALFAQRKISGYCARGVSLTTHGADMVIDKAVGLAGRSVQRIAANASQFESRTGISTLNTVAKVAVPAALTVGKLAGTLEQQSGLLAKRVAGTKAAHQKSSAKPQSRSKKPTARRAA